MLRFVLAFAVISLVASSATNLRGPVYYQDKFNLWLGQHKVVAKSPALLAKMLKNFADNDDIITRHNAGNHTYTLGHNQFSHLSLEEFKEHVKLGLARPPVPAKKLHSAPIDIKDLPAEVDWVAAGAVTPVKDQGQCGSCWAFSTTGALEGAYKIKTGELKSFSEQHLVDCDNPRNGGSDLGCNGGLMDDAFQWVQKNGGLCYSNDYPYVSGSTRKAGACDESKCTKDEQVAPVSFTSVQANSDAALMSALVQQPVSVAIQADESAFQLYKSGVLTAPCGANLDHGVLAVGYGTLDGVDYYKVKNSWGSSWGMDGYILLARGVSQPEGQCGILSASSYPNL